MLYYESEEKNKNDAHYVRRFAEEEVTNDTNYSVVPEDEVETRYVDGFTYATLYARKRRYK